MWCPQCKMPETKVVDSRWVQASNYIRRRRVCGSCQYRFTTHESVEVRFPRVIKRDGTKYQFSDGKLRAGILRALDKRPVKPEDFERLIVKILGKISQYADEEIPSKEIGLIVLAYLKELDEVAYVRFASVYQSFDNIESFQKVVDDLQKVKLGDGIDG